MIPLRRLSASEQLLVRSRFVRLLPFLAARGLGGEEARALAFNATLLFYAGEWRKGNQPKTPRHVLERMSLGEIAECCEEYLKVEDGLVEYGQGDGQEEEL